MAIAVQLSDAVVYCEGLPFIFTEKEAVRCGLKAGFRISRGELYRASEKSRDPVQGAWRLLGKESE